jgi:2-hydroxy-3-keto-5-methylthiopentenyl-1-phosphate phosphatase
MIEQKQPLVVVTDFDCTITYSHFYYFLNDIPSFLSKEHWKLDGNIDYIKLSQSLNRYIHNNIEIPIDEKITIQQILLGNDIRYKSLIDFLNFLKENNIPIYISSRGICHQIEKFLILFNLQEYFVNIINANQPSGPKYTCYTTTKDIFIKELLDNKYDKIIYIDDKNDEYNDIVEFDRLNNSNYNSNIKFYGNDQGVKTEQNGVTSEMIETIKNDIIFFLNLYYEQKYLKYKTKYLALKKLLNK